MSPLRLARRLVSRPFEAVNALHIDYSLCIHASRSPLIRRINTYQTERWSPPKEPQKPPIPYQKHTHLKIHRIQPPPPFTIRYWKFAPEDIRDFIKRERAASESDLKHLTMVEFCLSQKALPSTAIQKTSDLYVLDTIAVDDGRGAQVFTCTSSHEPGKTLVAKVYDPLYYPFMDEDSPGIPLDVVIHADADFTSEAAAYNHLNADLGGGLIPQYYGAWNFTQPLLGKFRTVNLILYEYIEGVPLSYFNPTSHTRSERLNILAKRMEAEVILYRHGFEHRDLAPRNIIVSPGYNGLGDSELQIRVIDFNRSEIYALTRSKSDSHRSSKERPESLIGYWEDDYPEQMAAWLDDEIYENMDGWNAWMRQRWGNDSSH